MQLPPPPRAPMMSFSMTSLVLGFLATLVFFMPILGIPIAVAGVVCGIIGIVFALRSPEYSIRWGLGGLGLSLLALSTLLALYYAPEAYLMRYRAARRWQPPADRPYVAPPASSPY
jgi:hypothetical protein